MLLGTWSAPAGTTTRGDVVEKFRTTDRAAAEDLFNACYPRLAGWVRRLVDDDETAHEIAAEAFTRLLARWSSLENPQSYGAMPSGGFVYVGMTTAAQGVAVPADPAQHAVWFTYDGGRTWQPSPVGA
jgi:hypothetical protein